MPDSARQPDTRRLKEPLFQNLRYASRMSTQNQLKSLAPYKARKRFAEKGAAAESIETFKQTRRCPLRAEPEQ